MIFRLIQRLAEDLTRPAHIRPWRVTEPEVARKDARHEEAGARRQAEAQRMAAEQRMHWLERALTPSSTDDAAGRTTEATK
jgi:hypothetical protein